MGHTTVEKLFLSLGLERPLFNRMLRDLGQAGYLDRTEGSDGLRLSGYGSDIVANVSASTQAPGNMQSRENPTDQTLLEVMTYLTAIVESVANRVRDLEVEQADRRGIALGADQVAEHRAIDDYVVRMKGAPARLPEVDEPAEDLAGFPSNIVRLHRDKGEPNCPCAALRDAHRRAGFRS